MACSYYNDNKYFFNLVGYGDIIPTTYIGRFVTALACILGTFVMSILVVFINDLISFDDIETRIYNSVIEEQSSDVEMKDYATKILFNLFLTRYLTKNRSSKTRLMRFNLHVELLHLVKIFKLHRMDYKKNETSNNEYLYKIKHNLDVSIGNFNSTTKKYIKDNMLKTDIRNLLRDSNNMLKDFTIKAVQLNNLQLIFNEKEYLKNLNKVDEVLDCNAYYKEEVLYYHNNIKNKQNNYDNTFDSDSVRIFTD